MRSSTVRHVLLCVAALIAAALAAGEASRVMLPSSAKKNSCLDRTPYGYYYRPALSPADNDKWVILAGDNNICVYNSDCNARLSSEAGSSKYWPKTKILKGLHDVEDHHNDFAKWNAIFLPDCTGDIFMGTASYHGDMSNYGGYNMISAMDHIINTLPIASATTVLLGGSGYGGLGMANFADKFADNIREASTLASAMEGRVGNADPAVFLVNIGGSTTRQNVTYQGSEPAPVSFIPFNDADFSSHQAYWTALVNSQCRHKYPYSYERGLCGFASYIYQTIETPTFMVQSQFDNHYIGSYTGLDKALVSEDGVCYDGFNSFGSCPIHAKSFLLQWAGNEEMAFENFFAAAADPKSPHGAFSAACMMHDEFSSTSPLIDGYSYINALQRWLEDGGKGKHLYKNSCSSSNPTCGACNM